MKLKYTIVLSKAQLMDVLREAYQGGYYGPLDLIDGAVEKIADDLIEKINRPVKIEAPNDGKIASGNYGPDETSVAASSLGQTGRFTFTYPTYERYIGNSNARRNAQPVPLNARVLPEQREIRVIQSSQDHSVADVEFETALSSTPRRPAPSRLQEVAIDDDEFINALRDLECDVEEEFGMDMAEAEIDYWDDYDSTI